MEDNILHLEVWAGDWDLPSVDSNCLATLAYCKFSGVPVKVKKSGNPWKSPSGNFPLMRHRDVMETKLINILSYLRKQNLGSDFNLSIKQGADVIAYMAMLESKLLPALLHLWWIDNDNYINLTRPWYTKAISFPLKFWVPGAYYRKVERRIFMGLGTENWLASDVESKIYADAKECLTLLSKRLDSAEYFFGNVPSSLDALVFGYMAPLLKAPLNSNQLTNHLRTYCDNLCIHCSRILRLFFPPTQEELEAKQKLEQVRKAAATDSVEFPNKRTNMILAGFFALTAMMTYAFFSGLIQIDLKNNEDPLS